MIKGYIDSYRGLTVQSTDPSVYKESVDDIVTSTTPLTFDNEPNVIAPIVIPLTDYDYTSNTEQTQRVIQNEMGISDSGENIYTGPQLVLSTDRILLNAKSDYILAFAKKGIALSAVGPVNIDSAEETVIASRGGVYLGPYITPDDKSADQKHTGAPKDSAYDQMVLGNKLANLIEDLIIAVSQLKVSTPQGEGYVSAETQRTLQKLISRLPETLSTYGFIIGTKHDAIAGPITPDPVQDTTEDSSPASTFGDFTPPPTSGSSDSVFIDPLKGLGRVTSIPGNRVNPVTLLPQNHGGLDLAAPRGTPVYAMADGTVVRSNNACEEGQKQCGGGLGNFVVIRHIDGVEAKYGHMTVGSVTVVPGDEVVQGVQLGTVGNTGASSGPHLHVQMRAEPGSKYISKSIPSADVAGRLNPLDFFNVT